MTAAKTRRAPTVPTMVTCNIDTVISTAAADCDGDKTLRLLSAKAAQTMYSVLTDVACRRQHAMTMVHTA